jgi:histidine ammonia-lyase
MLDNVATIVAIELLSAAQGIDFHQPNKTSGKLEQARATIRRVSPPYDSDRSLKPDVDELAQLVDAGHFYPDCRAVMPSA